MNKTCPKCGCGMTVEDDGRPMRVGRGFGVPDSYFCVARQRDQLLARNRELVDALQGMVNLLDCIYNAREDVTLAVVSDARAVLARAKEIKP